MSQEKDKASPRPDRAPDDQGILPDGIRGTTRDTGHTVPKDEHAGYGDPTRPDEHPARREKP